uniref:Uncharacterized protein n=1 Tax=Chromera velia CCMP2878 TaxID=1169474 RepID=A0A0G4HAB4_9ALVE|eukprot:Cvel_25494.t1-p1 / transcript=Cvel_25494.t1 / gene=Cvel_25494 / organism=Chromera_velia_CCMP2878 / gene_product=hypothetical protein / transcript_product=hypothetical protein / location=Cvel_scaffold2897:3597-5414(-) / protein_length=526 / sequence_SO=supercontig / SO=protein_coding / is_pseudo=false
MKSSCVAFPCDTEIYAFLRSRVRSVFLPPDDGGVLRQPLDREDLVALLLEIEQDTKDWVWKYESTPCKKSEIPEPGYSDHVTPNHFDAHTVFRHSGNGRSRLPVLSYDFRLSPEALPLVYEEAAQGGTALTERGYRACPDCKGSGGSQQDNPRFRTTTARQKADFDIPKTIWKSCWSCKGTGGHRMERRLTQSEKTKTYREVFPSDKLFEVIRKVRTKSAQGSWLSETDYTALHHKLSLWVGDLSELQTAPVLMESQTEGKGGTPLTGFVPWFCVTGTRLHREGAWVLNRLLEKEPSLSSVPFSLSSQARKHCAELQEASEAQVLQMKRAGERQRVAKTASEAHPGMNISLDATTPLAVGDRVSVRLKGPSSPPENCVVRNVAESKNGGLGLELLVPDFSLKPNAEELGVGLTGWMKRVETEMESRTDCTLLPPEYDNPPPSVVRQRLRVCAVPVCVVRLSCPAWREAKKDPVTLPLICIPEAEGRWVRQGDGGQLQIREGAIRVREEHLEKVASFGGGAGCCSIC